MKQIYLFFICLLFCTQLLGQNETSKWYFGANAGLNFMTNPPTPIVGSLLNTSEGSSGISDANGNLLFYTDGINVWTSTNALMANGTGLAGDPSSTQSAVVVKQAGNANIYYIFTMACCNSAVGLNYSIVDMSLAAGLGSVTVLNAPVAGNSAERLTSVRHCNGVDTWILSQDGVNGNFRAHLLTSLGLNAFPVISAIGTNSATGPASVGYMKLSPNGRKLGLAAANNPTTGFEIYDFDPATGIVSNRLFLVQRTNAYGCEFSPDGKLFYGALWGGSELFQWDLCAGANAAIIASQSTVATNGGGALQLAKNGKIYMTRSGQNTMGVINNPNVIGSTMNYVDAGQSIAPNTNQFGLPNFITSGLKQAPAPFTFTTNCQSASFTATQVLQNISANACSAASFSYTSILWNFGDPSSGAANTSTLQNPTHQYSAQGSYTPQLVIYYQCSSDTVKLPLTINGTSPTLSVTGTFTICKGQSKTFTVTGANTYSWSSASTNSTAVLSPTLTKVYNVSGTNTATGCSSNKSFTVVVAPCTGIEEDNYLNNTVSVYPNPVSGNLTIETKKGLDLVIYNAVGAIVYTAQMPTGKSGIDMTQFQAGVYTLKLSDGTSTKTTRLLKTD